jgi:hypothetical protein
MAEGMCVTVAILGVQGLPGLREDPHSSAAATEDVGDLVTLGTGAAIVDEDPYSTVGGRSM